MHKLLKEIVYGQRAEFQDEANRKGKSGSPTAPTHTYILAYVAQRKARQNSVPSKVIRTLDTHR